MSVLSVSTAGSGSAPLPCASGNFCPRGTVSVSGHISQAGEMENNLSKAAVPQFSAHWTVAALRRACGGWGSNRKQVSMLRLVLQVIYLPSTGVGGCFQAAPRQRWSSEGSATGSNFGAFLQFSVKYQEWQYRR